MMGKSDIPSVSPIDHLQNEPQENQTTHANGFSVDHGKRYSSRGVTIFQEPLSEGFAETLSLSTLDRIRRNIGINGKHQGRTAVADNGDLLVGLTVKNGSGHSQVIVRIESEEVFSKLAEMRTKAKKDSL